ncbi:LPS export ABC transporter permease LptF [Hydrogenophaga sp. NFH-34]|uniref:Lipopolysaccharide export system permease protein LptF n=2 Tax=Hydrogenophaga electricum TaxID=1230953 RepID=A0ABQ6BZ00_9BURK|nr:MULTISPECIES: LPS export ABC transporter permease LptF [Hydrogenophaga]GLS12870.1 LPS export ABC transporter permease LptF [Hydrogenophaga electricum]
MLFQSSLRKELARSFGATLVILFTIVLTMVLIRTLGAASRGSVNPEEIMLVLGYTVLGYTQTILALALFIAVVSVLSRMYRDSEMIIWFASGRSITAFLAPVLRFAWPILAVIGLMVFLVWPWANQQTANLRERFESRSDLQRIAPGQFQESSSGRRVFFIDKDTSDGIEGRNVFISSIEDDGRETVTTASAGRVETINDRPYLVLEQGQRMERDAQTGQLKISDFMSYGVLIGDSAQQLMEGQSLKARSTWSLIDSWDAASQGELAWRVGVVFSAINLIILGLAATVSNPRAGKSGNLLFTLFAFTVYFNLLNITQRSIATGQTPLLPTLVALHGGVLVLCLLWLAKRHQALSLRDLFIPKRLPQP